MSRIRGSLYYVDDTFDRMRITSELDSQQEAGFDLVWINGPVFRPEALAGLPPFDPVSCIMEEAAKRDMKVILEVMGREDWYKHWDVAADLEMNFEIIRQLDNRYACSSSFYGYYLGNEIYITHGREREYCLELWSRTAERCKETTPGCKVLLSPFFVSDRQEVLGYPYEEPVEYERFWKAILASANIDILMLQDSGAEHASCLALEDREPYFAALAQSCKDSGVVLWGNVELAEIEVQDYEGLKRFRADFGVNGSGFDHPQWIQVPLNKLIDKAALASHYCSDLVSWGYQQFVSPFSGKAGANAYYKEFKAWNTGSRIHD